MSEYEDINYRRKVAELLLSDCLTEESREMGRLKIEEALLHCYYAGRGDGIEQMTKRIDALFASKIKGA
jgi:hypothetical protein